MMENELSVFVVSTKQLEDSDSEKLDKYIRSLRDFIDTNIIDSDLYYLLLATEESEKEIYDLFEEYSRLGAVYAANAESSELKWLKDNDESLDMVEYLSNHVERSNQQQQEENNAHQVDLLVDEDESEAVNGFEIVTEETVIDEKPETEIESTEISDEELAVKIGETSTIIESLMDQLLPTKSEIEQILNAKLNIDDPRNNFMMCMKLQQEDSLMIAKSLLQDDLSHLQKINNGTLREQIQSLIENGEIESYSDYARVYELLEKEKELVQSQIESYKAQYEKGFEEWIAAFIEEKRREYETMYPPKSDNDFWADDKESLDSIRASLDSAFEDLRSEIVDHTDGKINMRGLKALHSLQKIRHQLENRYMQAAFEFDHPVASPIVPVISAPQIETVDREVVLPGYEEDETNNVETDNVIASSFVESDDSQDEKIGTTDLYQAAVAAAAEDEDTSYDDEDDSYADSHDESEDDSEEYEDDEPEDDESGEEYEDDEQEDDESEVHREYAEDEGDDDFGGDEGKYSPYDGDDYEESEGSEEDELDEDESEEYEEHDEDDEPEDDSVNFNFTAFAAQHEADKSINLLDGVELEKAEDEIVSSADNSGSIQDLDATPGAVKNVSSKEISSFDEIVEDAKNKGGADGKKQKSGKRKFIILTSIISFLLVITISVGGYFLLSGDGKSPEGPAVTPEASQQMNPAVEKIQSNFKKGDRMEVIVNSGVVPVKIESFNESGAVAVDSSGKQWLITNELLQQWIEAHPDQFKSGQAKNTPEGGNKGTGSTAEKTTAPEAK